MSRPLGSKNKKKGSKDNRDKLQQFIETCEKIAQSDIKKKPEPEPEPKAEKAPAVSFKGKRSTGLMYEVLPWVAQVKYNELAVN